MACGCEGKKKSLFYIEQMAKRFSMIEKNDVQIYVCLDHNGETIYDFEPINENRLEVIKVIEYSELLNEGTLIVNDDNYTAKEKTKTFKPGEAMTIIHHPLTGRILDEDEYTLDENFNLTLKEER